MQKMISRHKILWLLATLGVLCVAIGLLATLGVLCAVIGLVRWSVRNGNIVSVKGHYAVLSPDGRWIYVELETSDTIGLFPVSKTILYTSTGWPIAEVSFDGYKVWARSLQFTNQGIVYASYPTPTGQRFGCFQTVSPRIFLHMGHLQFRGKYLPIAAVSRDGRKVAFVKRRRLTIARLSGISVNGVEAEIERLGFVDTIAWSPDAKILAFVSRSREKKGWHLEAYDCDRRVSRRVLSSELPLSLARFDPTGKHLAVMMGEKVAIVCLRDGRVKYQLISNWAPSWSWDGNLLTFTTDEGGGRVYCVHGAAKIGQMKCNPKFGHLFSQS